MNPLINYDELPYYSSIKAKHAIPALKQILKENRDAIHELESLCKISWESFALQMESLDERVGRVWSPISHLHSVADSEDLRAAYEKGISLLTDYYNEVGQNLTLFNHYKNIQRSSSFDNLTKAQKKIIANAVLDFQISGAELNKEDKLSLRNINQSLSELSSKFQSNVLDATQAWNMHVTDIKDLRGVKKSALTYAAKLAQDKNLKGFIFTLQIPSYLAIMQHCDDESLRKRMYKAYCTRASSYSENPEFDNSTLIEKILQLKNKKSQLLGFRNYTDYSLVKKMASSRSVVLDLLSELASHALPIARNELKELTNFAKDNFNCNKLQAWDVSYYSEKLREHSYSFSDEQIKQYFPIHQVFEGLFDITKKLFSVSISPNTEMQTWHQDVCCFDLHDSDTNQYIGSLYADLYVRENKRGGAWMDTCIERRITNQGIQHPVAYLTCNFSPPIDGASSANDSSPTESSPALLTHDEVETLFHEFGHTLHHLLTKVDEIGVSGINGVAWDAVELPSQFLENWCWQKQGINLIAKHFKTNESLPDDLLEKMRSAKNFQSGMQTLRQIELALFDIEIHSKNDTNLNQHEIQSILNDIRTKYAVLTPPDYNRFQNSFSHIFSGGYAAGYYSYKWSEVLSADAFSKFEEDGIFNPLTGKLFKETILEQGGSEDANTLFEQFRGRPPEIKPLLQHTGIL